MIEDALPLKVLVGDPATGLIEVYDDSAALRSLVVNRASLSQVASEEWDVPGVYILVDRHTPDGTWGAYVGKSPAGTLTRVKRHLRTKDYWYRAVLFTRDTSFGFNSAQVGWLEGRLHDLLHAADAAVLHNNNRPSDETLPLYERQALENTVLPIVRLLYLLGHSPSSSDDNSETENTTPNKYHGVTLKDLITGGVLDIGSALTSTNGAWPAVAKINSKAEIVYGDSHYQTPSSAARAVKNGSAVNGWEFWAVQEESGLVPLATLRDRFTRRATEP